MKPYYTDSHVELYHGDFREVCLDLPEDSVELVLCDPPYPKEYLRLFAPMGEQANRLLVDQGSCVSLCGHYQVPAVLSAVEKHLRFWWMCGMLQNKRTRMGGKWVNIWWKPAIWWVKRQRRLDLTSMLPNDMEKGAGNDKSLHKWQQPVNWFENWVTTMTKPGEVVADFFAGSGTTLAAAKMHDRFSIGVEIDEEACEVAAKRLESVEVLEVQGA